MINVDDILIKAKKLKNKWERREMSSYDDHAKDAIGWCIDDLNEFIQSIKTSPCLDLLDHKRLPGEDVCIKCGFKFK